MKIRHIDSDYDRIDYRRIADEIFYSEPDDLDIDYLGKKGLTYDSYFPETDELAEFIYLAYNNGMDIICQSEYGQIRSADCAALYSTGIDVFTDYRRYPNQIVYHKVFNALNKYKQNLQERVF